VGEQFGREFPTGATLRRLLEEPVASLQTDSVASGSAAKCVQLGRQSGRTMEIFPENAY
jgi:hypothetical protein